MKRTVRRFGLADKGANIIKSYGNTHQKSKRIYYNNSVFRFLKYSKNYYLAGGYKYNTAVFYFCKNYISLKNSANGKTNKTYLGF